MSEVEPRFKIIRIRSEKHLKRIRGLRCAVPGCQQWRFEGVVAHHLTVGEEPKARGLKAGDDWTVPLCAWTHHDPRSPASVHWRGDERAWWAEKGVDPILLARQCAEASRARGILR